MSASVPVPEVIRAEDESDISVYGAAHMGDRRFFLVNAMCDKQDDEKAGKRQNHVQM